MVCTRLRKQSQREERCGCFIYLLVGKGEAVHAVTEHVLVVDRYAESEFLAFSCRLEYAVCRYFDLFAVDQKFVQLHLRVIRGVDDMVVSDAEHAVHAAEIHIAAG